MQIKLDPWKVTTEDLIALTDETTPWSQAIQCMAKHVVGDDELPVKDADGIAYLYGIPFLELKNALVQLLKIVQAEAIPPQTAAN